MIRASSLGLVLSVGCATQPSGPAAVAALVPTTPPLEPARASESEAWPEPVAPWWASLATGSYRLRGRELPDGPLWLAVGRSEDHHHPTEGILHARVEARLAVLERSGPEARPFLVDLFVSRDGTTYALYAARHADPDAEATPVGPPAGLAPRPRGRHSFAGTRHLYLECAVEGPLTNPEWGATRYSAHLTETQP